MRLSIKIFCFFIITSFSFSQVKSEIVTSSVQYNIVELKSEYFPNENRIIKVFLPKDYDKTKKYPVIYTLDGNSLFDLTAKYVEQLSKVSKDAHYDYATEAIPQSIVIGIYHNDRNYETSPNFTKLSYGDETLYLEGSEKLKNFLFKEIVPYVNTNYNISGYNLIVGHSNTAHFVMCLPFQSENPFRGIIALSLSGESANFKNKIKSYLESNRQTNVFIGFGTKDFGFNEFAKYIKDEVVSENLSVSEFNANHNEMPALSLIQGLKFLFNEYRNLEDFNLELNKNNFDFKSYLELYKTKNKVAYGISTEMKEDDFYSLLQMSINSKNSYALNQILDYDLKVNGNPTQTHMLFVYNKEIGDFKKAEYFANQILSSKDDFENRVLKANLELYYDFFINDIKDVRKSISFFEEGRVKFEDSKLTFSYFIAKTSIDNNFRKTTGTSNLKYCLQNYKQNKYFTEFDLKKLLNK